MNNLNHLIFSLVFLLVAIGFGTGCSGTNVSPCASYVEAHGAEQVRSTSATAIGNEMARCVSQRRSAQAQQQRANEALTAAYEAEAQWSSGAVKREAAERKAKAKERREAKAKAEQERKEAKEQKAKEKSEA